VFDELVYAKNIARGGIPGGSGVVTSSTVGGIGSQIFNNPIDPVNLGLPGQQQQLQTVVSVQQHSQQVLPRHHVVQVINLLIKLFFINSGNK